MNNKSSGSRRLFPSYRDQEFSHARSERYLGMPDRLSYEQILRSRSTISFDRGRPYDSPSMLQENDSMYGRGRNEGRYGRDSFRLDSNRPDLPSQSFRTDPDSQFNPHYPERDILERERLSALRNRNLHMSEDSGSSFHRSRPMDTPLPKSYREHVPDVDSLRKKFENHIRSEMLELSQELPPSRFGLRLGNAHSRREDLEVNEIPLGSQLRNSQPLEDSSGKSIGISSSDPPMWDKDSQSRDSLWNNNRTSTEFLGGKEKPPYSVGVRIKDIPPENSPWENERAQYSESRLKHDDQSPPFPIIKDSSSLKVPFSDNAAWNIEGAIQSVALQTKSASPQLSLEKTSTTTILSTGVEPNDLIDEPEPSNNPNNPVYSDAYISNLVCHQPVTHNRNSNANSTEPSSEDSSQKFAKEDPIPFEQYPAYSIPFLGETASTPNTGTDSKSKHENILNQVKPEDDDSILSNSSHSKSGENDKMKSTLEDALETLMLKDPIVGLDYIVEYKDIVSSDGGFPFYCNLCKSSISRSLIIDHVKGFKHGLKYLKTKNENASEYVLNHVKNQTEKEEYVYKAMEHLEQTYGKGRVVVKLKSSERKQSPLQICFGKVPPKVASPISELEEPSVVEPLTLAKIDEMSRDSNMDGVNFINEENSSSSSQQNSVRKECKGKDDANNPLTVKVDGKINESEKKVTENVTSPLVSRKDLEISSCNTLLENKSLKRPADEQQLSGQVKMHKPEVVEILDSADDDDVLIEEVRLNNFNFAILDKLTQCSITNEEEANVVRKVVETLLKLLLQYNLQHIANEDRTRLISEVQSRPFQTMEKLQELLKLQSQSGTEDAKLRLNSDFSIRGKNLAFSTDNATPQPTVSPNLTKPPVSTTATDSSTDPHSSKVQPQQPVQHQGLSPYPGSSGNVNHPPNKVPLPLPNYLLGEKPPPPPPENPIPPPPLPPLGSTLSAPPPPPPLPPEPPLCKPPLPSPSKNIPLPPPNQMKSTLPPPPPPMAPAMGSSTFLPNPYQMYAGQHHIPSTQSKQVLLPAGPHMMPSVGGMMVPPAANMLSPHFMPIPTGILPNQSRLPDQTQGLLPNPGYSKGGALLPSHRYAMMQPPPLPPS